MSNMSSDEEGPTLTLFTCCDHLISKQLTLHTRIIDGPYGGIPTYSDLLQDGRAPVMLAGSELDLLLVEHVVVLEALRKAMLQACAQEGTIEQLQLDLSLKASTAEVLHTRLTKANQRAFAAEQDLLKIQTQYKQLLDDDRLTKATEELASATTRIEELERDLLQTCLCPLDLVLTAVQTSPSVCSSVGIQTSAPCSSISVQALAPTSHASSGTQTIAGKIGIPTPLPPTTILTSYAQAVQRQHPPASLPPPIFAPSHAVSPAIAGYKGSRATKANELHFFVRSWHAFNQRLTRSFLEPTGCNRINHCHTFVTPFFR